GIIVVTVSVITAFYHYLAGVATHQTCNSVKYELANGLATSLSFKMAGELLKTVIVRDLNELALLGIIILLRALLAVLIHFEIYQERKEKQDGIPTEPHSHNDRAA
ncbi:MAG: DUF1622 domain-containing protein, partial [Oscillospiraceae bacterium]